MEITVVTKNPEINSVPYYELFINSTKQYIEFEDVAEKRWRVEFKIVQAWKITTFDCFDLELLDTNESLDENGKNHHYLLEVNDSQWIKELKKELNARDNNAKYLQESHHYILPLGEEIIEIVAWDNYILERVS